MAATPLPSSLMPGPSGTLSRWAPLRTTSSVRPVVVWAITERVVRAPAAPSSSSSSLVTAMVGVSTRKPARLNVDATYSTLWS